MDRPAQASASNDLQRGQSSRSVVLSCCKSGRQTRKTVEGASFLGGVPSLHAVFFSSPSSAKGNPRPLSAESATSSPPCSASTSACTSERGSKSPCWTFLPVGSLEAKKKDRGLLVSKGSSANATVASAASPCRETQCTAGTENGEGQVTLSSGEHFSQSPSSCKPPTFEQLLCLSTDEEKDAAAATLPSNESKKPLNAAFLDECLSQNSASAPQPCLKEQLDDACYVAPPSPVDLTRKLSTGGSTESSSEGWQRLHVDRADKTSTKRQHRHNTAQEVPAKKDFQRSCTETRDAVAEEVPKGEKAVRSISGGVRHLRFNADTFKSSEEHKQIVHPQRHRQQHSSVQGKVELRPPLSLHPTHRTGSRDGNRGGLRRSDRKAAKLHEETPLGFSVWMTDTEGNTDSSDGWSTEGSSGCERKKEYSSTQRSRREREVSAQRLLCTHLVEKCSENRGAQEDTAQGEDTKVSLEKLIDQSIRTLRRASLQGGGLATAQTNAAGFLTTADRPSDNSTGTALSSSPAKEREKKERHYKAEPHGSRTRSSSEPCFKGKAAPAAAAAKIHSLEGREDQQHTMKKQETRKYHTEGSRPCALVCPEAATEPHDREAVSKHVKDEKAKETSTEERERELASEKREETKGSSDAERQSGYDGGSSHQERPHKRKAKSGKKHRRSKKEFPPGERRCSSQRISDAEDSALAPRGSREDKAEQQESSSSTIPPHPLFIPGLRLSLLTKHRKGRANESAQPPSRCNERIAECKSSRRVASTCIASQAACGIFGAETSEDDGADDDSASVRHERSLLSSLFTLSSTPSPSRKQQLRRTIKRYALFRLCSDGETSGEEERDGAVSASHVKKQLDDLHTDPEAEVSVETKTQHILDRASHRTSTVSPSSNPDGFSGKTKPRVRVTTRTDEEHSYLSERRSLRSTRCRRKVEDKCQRGDSTSDSSSSRSDICRLRFPFRAAAVGHFSEDFSNTPSQAYSAAERLYSPLEPVTELKKPGSYRAGNISSNTQWRPLQTESCSVRPSAGVSALARVSADDAEELYLPSYSQTVAIVRATEKTVSRAAAARSSPCDNVLSPSPTGSRGVNEGQNSDFPYSQRVRQGHPQSGRMPPDTSEEEVSARFPAEWLSENTYTCAVQPKTKLLRRPPGKRKESKQKRYASSYYSSTSSLSTSSEGQRQSQRSQHVEHKVCGRKSPDNKLRSIKKERRQVIARASSRATHSCSEERCILRRNCSAEVPAAVAGGDFVATVSTPTEDRMLIVTKSPSCASAASSNTAVSVTADWSTETRENFNSDDGTQKNSSISQRQSRLNVAHMKERNTKAVCLAPQGKPHRVQNQKKNREQIQQDDGVNEETWEDLGGPRYKTEIKEKCDPAKDTGAVLVKTKPIIRSDKHLNAGSVRLLASRPIQACASISQTRYPSAQQQSCSADGVPQGRPNESIQEDERLPSSGDSGGCPEAEIPSAFDTLWEGSFRGVMQPQGYLSTASRDLVSDCSTC